MSLLSKYGTPAEVSRGLVFCEKFESQSLVAKNDGTLFGSPYVSNGITLNGTSQYSRYPQINFDTSLTQTFIFDFKINSFGANRELLSIGASFEIYITSAGKISYYYGVSKISNNLVSIGRNKIAVVYDGANLIHYLNGVSNGSVATASVTKRTGNMFLGVYNGSSQFLNGAMYSVKIFQTALTAQEILDDYNNSTYITQ